MSVPDTAVPARPTAVPSVRAAVPADHLAIREVVIAAYRQYADLIPPDVFSPYLARPATLWLTALRRPTNAPSPRTPCAEQAPGQRAS